MRTEPGEETERQAKFKLKVQGRLSPSPFITAEPPRTLKTQAEEGGKTASTTEKRKKKSNYSTSD